MLGFGRIGPLIVPMDLNRGNIAIELVVEISKPEYFAIHQALTFSAAEIVYEVVTLPSVVNQVLGTRLAGWRRIHFANLTHNVSRLARSDRFKKHLRIVGVNQQS